MNTFHGVRIPSSQTLKKYGITLPEWKSMLKLQGGTCFVCEKIPPSRILHIDHEHVKGWKSLKPEQRKVYCRGLLCAYCNFRRVNKSVNLKTAKRVVLYLQRHEERIDKLNG